MKPLVTSLYSSVIKVRNWAFENNFLEIKKVNVPVVSVGNITTGGTGKTPVVDHFLKWSEQKGIKAGVVSRGYGGNYSGVQKVGLSFEPSVYGDEPTMLALNNPANPVYVGRDRVLAAKTLVENEKIDIIFADDCFQHRRLHRDINIVIIDLLEDISHYNLLPFGRGREPLAELVRADAIVSNKRNLVSAKDKEERENYIRKFVRQDSLWIHSDYIFGGVRSVFDGSLQKQQGNYLLLSGIGNPHSFEKIVEENNFNFSHHIRYRDHYKYDKKTVLEVENQAKSMGIKHILTTNKDAVKVRGLIGKTNMTWSYVDLKIQMEGVDRLYEEIICLLS